MASISNITFACEDPAGLARFWADALGYDKERDPPEIVDALVAEGKDPNVAAAASDPKGRGPRLFFLRQPKSRTESMPIHLDVGAKNRETEVARLVELGATEVGERSLTLGPITSVFTYMRDPEGNGFCVQ